ncbi:MAG: hypothetical protein FRX48_03651 [Lasallia pustulata]|uniref:Uncharacterized protein n=1 Tax=Lasallia pustulata TaxID=136370 RepID=A0A5M8PUE2_9LECA|nr:MAG: hypothetical protein FRX48_03651 [Lasallia pustulata]
MAPSTTNIPSAPLPFAADTHSLNHWRRAQSLASAPQPSSHAKQTFEAFLATATARDISDGIATKPIAPSIISELSASHKRLIRRYRRLWWILLVLVEATSISSVAALVFLVQGAEGEPGTRPAYLIWFLLSFTAFTGLALGLMVVWIGRRRRSRWERERRDGEVEKWKREARRMGREMVVLRVQAGRLGRSLRDVSRGVSREGTVRSVSRGRRRRGERIEEGAGEEVNRGRTWDGTSRGPAGQEGQDLARIAHTKDLPPLPGEDSLTIHYNPVSELTGSDPGPGPSFPPSTILPHPSMKDLTQYLDAEIRRRSTQKLTRISSRTNHIDLEAGPRSNPEIDRNSTWTHKLDLEPDDRSDVRDDDQRSSNIELNRISTWTHHLDLSPSDDDEHDQPHPLNPQPHAPTPAPPTPPPLLPSLPSPSPYLFPRPSFPSFHLPQAQPSDLDPTPSSQSDANFLAANTAASDAE